MFGGGWGPMGGLMTGDILSGSKGEDGVPGQTNRVRKGEGKMPGQAGECKAARPTQGCAGRAVRLERTGFSLCHPKVIPQPKDGTG